MRAGGKRRRPSGPSDYARRGAPPPAPFAAGPTLEEYLVGQRRQYIDSVLHASHGDKAAAAKVLGIPVAELG